MLVGTTGAILFFLLLGYNFKLDNSSPRKQIATSVNFDWTVAFVNDLTSLKVFCCNSGYLAARAIGCSEISVTEYTLNNSHKHVAHFKSASGLSCHCTCDTASSCRCPWRQMHQSNASCSVKSDPWHVQSKHVSMAHIYWSGVAKVGCKVP